jgi:hypothetical protein
LSDDSRELCAEDEGWLDVAFVVLVKALCVEKVDMGYCCVGDFYADIFRMRELWLWDMGRDKSC